MKTVKELREILQSVPFTAVDAHIHTHLCDGAPDMTVENIARSAKARGVQLIVLTPHFHLNSKALSSHDRNERRRDRNVLRL